MSAPNLPQSILDGSLLRVLSSTLEQFNANETLTPAALTDVPDIDWPAYNAAFFQRLPEEWQHHDLLPENTGTRLWLISHLPSLAIGELLHSTPTKQLWSYLNGKSNLELLLTVTKGFQRTPAIVKQPAVRTRLLHWFEHRRVEIFPLLTLWAQQPPEVLEPIASIEDSPEKEDALHSIVLKFGPVQSLLGLTYTVKPQLFAHVSTLLESPEELTAVLSASDSEVQPRQDTEGDSKWQQRVQKLETELKAAHSEQKQAHKYQSENKKLQQEITRVQLAAKNQTALWENKLAALEGRLKSETEKLTADLERTARKLRSLELEHTETEAENKRLKKQLRNTQQLLEDEKRKVSALENRLNPKPVPEPQPEPAPVKKPAKTKLEPPSPLDTIYEWKADGRLVRVVPRAVRRLIDQNDEEAVFTIMQALDSLKISDKALYTKFLTVLSEGEPFYKKVLTEATSRVLVDASNVTRSATNRFGKGKLDLLLQMRAELRRLGFFPIILVADASLPYNINEPNQLREMAKSGEIVMADKGTEADEVLAREARRTGASVVTNDAKFFHKVSPDFEPPRIGFRVLDGTVIVEDY